MTHEKEYINILMETLKTKEQILSDLLKITREQEQLADINTFSDDKFDATIDAKEKLINRINDLDFGFDATYTKVRPYILENKDAYKQEIAALQVAIRKCTDIGVELQTLEIRNKEKFEQVFSTKKKELRQVKTTQSVASNYYKTMSNTQVVDSYFFNKKK